MSPPSVASVLETLPKARLIELGRQFGVGLSETAAKEAQIAALQSSGQVRLQQLVEWMGRDELRRACERHGMPTKERARPALAGKLLDASGAADSKRPSGLFGVREFNRHAPRVGDIAQVRQRQYLVEGVTPPPEPSHATVVDLVCLDDDNQGRKLQVLWELELGARVLQPEAEGLGQPGQLDPPRHFAAYLHALRWNSVTATQADLFQSPFRAGIKLYNHQLIPLKKALALPRANLFIADDVGLGKTIEAGLVLQELELRQRVDFVLIVCPASICLQWKSEMEKRFGQRFEIYDRDFVARRRSERGFGVQAWSTQNRFIISYQLLRRPEYFEPLLQHLGPRLKKSLLVLDEAHTAAPSTSSKYAVDSHTTAAVTKLASSFENRLFLSATPHNGHSNSFSALMEILDPQRFTRGVPIQGQSGALGQVMVRRLKRDLRGASLGTFPLRKVVRVALEGAHEELRLAELLAEYSELMRPRKGKGQLVFINLQKRLLSSVEAFTRTLEVHAERVAKGEFGSEGGEGGATIDLPPALSRETDVSTDQDEDQLDRNGDEVVREQTATLPVPTDRAQALLTEMLSLAKKLRRKPDAKVTALIDWIRTHQLTGKKWNDTRLLVFTEYADTKRYLTDQLEAAFEDTDQAEERIGGFHGAMSEEQREQVQRHFNGSPHQYPLRILIATDAAREGLNLQNHCADLFHFDIPWNPARMEQRNGRIDRTLQPSPEVRCHYFVYTARKEDAVLEKLVHKVDTIQEELGSLGDVVLSKLESALEHGIGPKTEQALDQVDPPEPARVAVQAELESSRADLDALRRDTDEAGRILDRSRSLIDFEPERLIDAVNVGLELAGAGALIPLNDGQYELPALGQSWAETLDSLRPPRERDEPPWEWRKKKPQPVVFRPLERMGEDRVHLHLEHPFIQRILSRFRAQGYSARDLSRVTVVPNSHDATVRVIAFGRVSLFGPGAARLHDELISVAAPWFESQGPGHLKPFSDEADRRAVDKLKQLFREQHDPIPAATQARLLASAPGDFAALWAHIQDEAEARAHAASQKLTARSHEEAVALRTILTTQRDAIARALRGRQLDLFEELNPDEQKQWQNDKQHMEGRLAAIEREIESEPAAIEALYQVSLQRLEPVGLVYLWPTTRL